MIATNLTLGASAGQTDLRMLRRSENDFHRVSRLGESVTLELTSAGVVVRINSAEGRVIEAYRGTNLATALALAQRALEQEE